MLRQVLLVIALVCAASGEVVLKEVTSTEKEGLSHKSYVLVDGQDQDGKDKVVGFVQHIRAGPGVLGRRAGPPEGQGVGPLLLPVLDNLFAQMHASRCAMMKAFADDFSRVGMPLAPVFSEASQSPDGAAPGHPMPLFGAQPARTGMVVLPPFQLRAMPWQDGNVGPAHYFGGMGEHHRLMGQEGDWLDLQDDTMPTVEDDINWSFYNEDGSLNVGLLMFVLLSAACLGVWIAGIFTWLSYCRAMREHEQQHSRVQFLTSKGVLPKGGSGDLLAPLVHEGPVDSPKLYTGVEFAAEHADPTAPKGAALQYEPPKL